MAIEIVKQCPFCGSSNLGSITDDDGHRVMYCHRCGCKGPQYSDRGWYWNSRFASDKSDSARVEYIQIAGRTFWDWLSEFDERYKRQNETLFPIILVGVIIAGLMWLNSVL